MNKHSLDDIQYDANQIINDKLIQIYALLRECENLAKEAEICFRFSPVRGMGGYFDGEDQEWLPSSQSC